MHPLRTTFTTSSSRIKSISALSKTHFFISRKSHSSLPTKPTPIMSLESASSQWLADQLSTLLSSPYIHFPPAPHHAFPQLRMGPGPIDLFSTRFENLFTKDASGVVAGKEVDRDTLKDTLLALQKTWNPEHARFIDNPDQDGVETALTMDWNAPHNEEQHLKVAAEASLKQEGGTQRISSLKLDGDQSLFKA